MWVGGGITGMGEIPMLGVREKGIAKVIRDIFRGGEQGFFYDPNDLSTMYRDAEGTAPVTDVGQPVGLLLDKSRGLVLGANLVKPNADSVIGTTVKVGDATYRITTPDSTNAYFFYSNIPVGAVEIDYEILQVTSGSIRIDSSANSRNIPSLIGRRKAVLYNTRGAVAFVRQTAPTDVTVKVHSIRQILGNHTYQTNSAARPIFRQKAILGSELVVNGDASNGTDGWITTNATLQISDGSFVMAASSQFGGVTKPISLDTSKTYELNFTVTGTTANAPLTAIIRPAGTTTNYAQVGILTAGKYKLIFKPTAVSSRFMVQHGNATPTGSVSFTNVSIKEVLGYLTDQNYIEYDGVDDKLITNLPAQLTGCTVIRSVPNVGTQILTGQTIPATYEDNTDHCGLIVINRALTPSETSAITSEFNKRAGV